MKKPRALMTAHGEEEDEDYFGRLPDDVIVDMFNRVNDSKLLTQCLLLSKRIASLIPLVSSVSINIHLEHVNQNPNPIEGSKYNSIRHLYKLISPENAGTSFSSWSDAFIFYESAHLYNCMALEAFQPFVKVKSAIIEYTSLFSKVKYPQLLSMDTLKWIVEYSGGVNIIKNCAFLIPIFDTSGITTSRFSRLDEGNIIHCVGCLFWSAFTFLPMVSHMVHDHESLHDILVTIPSSKGWIHAGEDEIVKMRQAGVSAYELMKMMVDKHVRIKIKAWCITVPDKSIYAFVVVSNPDSIDSEVKAATRRFWGDSSYWVGHHDQDVMIQEAGFDRKKMRELVEKEPCNFEYVWQFTMLHE